MLVDFGTGGANEEDALSRFDLVLNMGTYNRVNPRLRKSVRRIQGVEVRQALLTSSVDGCKLSVTRPDRLSPGRDSH